MNTIQTLRFQRKALLTELGTIYDSNEDYKEVVDTHTQKRTQFYSKVRELEDEKDEFKITFKNNNKTPKDSNFISQKDSEMTTPKESIFKKIINIKSTPEQIIRSLLFANS